MPLSAFTDHPGRFQLSNELHARPFPEISTPCQAMCLAFRNPDGNDASEDRAHLLRLLERSGSVLPPEDANHYYGRYGNHMLKWERHTEFVSYTVFIDGDPENPFRTPADIFPPDWSAAMPGKLLTATLLHVRHLPDGKGFGEMVIGGIDSWFVRESTAMSLVLDGNALVAGDFRIDANGWTRFAVVAKPEMGRRRLGRICQRLMEVENYKAMAMLTLPAAREVGAELTRLDERLSDVVTDFAQRSGNHDRSLAELLNISEQIEHLAARHASRFSAAEAYSSIVDERIGVLRETRFEGRQTFAEFMARRFRPAMRTCASTAERLSAVAGRTARAGEMLRTRVDVARAEQNQAILSRMDERAAQQLRLQQTVEGLSVVAVSYYALNLASYLLAPLAYKVDLDKTWLTAILVIPVVLAVWRFIHGIKKHL